MRFSDFVQLMHRYIGCSVTQQEYVLYLTNLVIRDPMTDDEKKLDEDDALNPLSGKKDMSSLSKIYSGTDNRKIKQIEILPDGDSIIVIWFKILCLAGNTNDNGFVYFTHDIPYTDQMLAAEFNRPLATIQIALNIFERFGMIDIVDNIIHVSSWEKYQNVDGLEKIKEQNRLRQAKYKEKQKDD